MTNSLPSVPYPSNEPIKSYAPGSVEKKEVLSTYKNLYNTSIEIKMRIGNKDVKSDNKASIYPPHDNKHKIGFYYRSDKKHIEQAIKSALESRENGVKCPGNQELQYF